MIAPGYQLILLAVFSYVPIIFIFYLFARLQTANDRLIERGREIRMLTMGMEEQRKAVQAIEDVARMEERNRLAARIHDEVGHGISGSIMLLEGAMLILPADPEKSREVIGTATENLRKSVDDIRLTLREERSGITKSSLARINAELSKFGAAHPGIAITFTPEGDLTGISVTIWTCIHENLLEAMSNLLKHSAADHFEVTVSNKRKVVKAVFINNGVGGETPPVSERNERVGGMGLIHMEERCAVYGGRFFTQTVGNEFRITMIFPVRMVG
jgi:signal transduction histidine kinase